FTEMNIYLVESNDRVLAAMSPQASIKAKRYLEGLSVIVKTSSFVDKYDGTSLHLRSGEKFESYCVVWSAGVTGNVLQGMPDEWTEKAHYIVDDHCRVIGSKNIFAIGDIAILKSEKWPNGLPGQAQPAIQMGTYVGRHLGDLHRQRPVKPFKFFDKGA